MPFSRKEFKFVCKGLDLNNPPDMMPEGYYPVLNNIRVLQEGGITLRSGLSLIQQIDPGLPANESYIHTIKRLNKIYAGLYTRFVGNNAGTIWGGGLPGTYSQLDAGYSGFPVSMVPFRPNASPEPFLYVGDSIRMSKFRENGVRYNMGIVPPLAAPSTILGTPNYLIINNFQATTGWTDYGTGGAITSAARFNTTIAHILYDSGTTGWATIAPTSFTQVFQQGALPILGGTETVKITDIFPAITNTTIQSIAYDSGNTGACCIVLTGSSAGLVPNCMVELNTEYVKVVSVTVGPDFLPSFRCVTANTHAAGENVTGVGAFRAYTVGTFAATATITGNQVSVAIAQGIGGMSLTQSSNLNLVGNRPTTVDDYIHISLLIDNPSNLVEGRIQIDVSDGTFTANYYYYTLRPSDFQANATGTLTAIQAQQLAIQNQILSGSADLSVSTIDAEAQTLQTDFGSGLGVASSVNPVSGQATIGTGQWTEILFKISDLTRVGSDMTKTLANVVAVNVTLNVLSATNLTASSWWVGGTYGADVGDNGSPFIHSYRYRSSLTGAVSNNSPVVRSGWNAYRDRVLVTVAASGDAQVDYIDIFRAGGNADNFLQVLSVPNATTTYNDDLDTISVEGNNQLPFDDYQPFPITDLPRKGICNVVGTTVTWVSGDTFNLNWVQGTLITIGNMGQTYSLYGTPVSTTQIQLQQSASSQTGVPFVISQATIAGQPLPVMWEFGGLSFGTFMFGVGDANNPGFLHWTKGNSPDTASDKGSLEITSPSEPLQAGCTYDGQCYVFSTDRMFTIIANFGNGGSDFIAQEVPGSKGMSTRWGLAVGPEIYWVSKSAICAWSGGAPRELSRDISILFPKDGVAGKVPDWYGFGGHYYYNVPNFQLPQYNRLFYADDSVFYVYPDVNGLFYTLRYNLHTQGWTTETYNYTGLFQIGASCFYEEEGVSAPSVLVATADGSLTQIQGVTTDSDGSNVTATVITPSLDFGDSRLQKLFTDAYLEADTQGYNQINLTPIYNDLSIAGSFSPTFASNGVIGRVPTYLQIANQSLALYTDIALQAVWTGPAILFEFQPAAQLQPYLATSFVTQFTDHGFTTYGHVRDAHITLISVSTVTLYINVDQVQYSFTIPATNGLYLKYYLVLPPLKGLTFQYKATSSAPFSLFGDETSINIKEWGSFNPYTQFRPFQGLLGSAEQ